MKGRPRKSTLSSVAFMSFLLFNTTLALAQNQQIITPDPATQTAQGNQAVSIDVNYSTNPADQLLTGLGLRLHFNSTQLTFANLTNVLSTDLIATGTPQPDTSDFDQNPNTDMLVVVSWTNINGMWPQGVTFPVRLYTANFTTVETFSESTSVNFSASSTATGFTLAPTSATIGPFVNTPPMATAQMVTTTINMPVDTTLAGTDPDTGQTLTFTIATQPTNGMLSGTPPAVTYTPNTNFTGDDAFTFTANDGTADSQAATVMIVVSAQPPSPNAPAVAADTASTLAATPVTINVLDNDSDADGDTLTVVEVSTPTGGGMAVTDGTTVTYTPAAGFIGTDMFTYSVSDGSNPAVMGGVMVTVSAATVGAGDQSPDETDIIDVMLGDENVPVLQVAVTTGGEVVTLSGTNVDFSQLMGNSTLGNTVIVSLINDVDGNGMVDDGEAVLASRVLSELTDSTLPLPLNFDIPANSTVNLLVTLTIMETGSVGSTSASVLSPMLPIPTKGMGWLVMLPSVVGLVFFRRLRHRSMKLFGMLLLVMCLSVTLISCDDDGGGEELSFTVGVQANAITGQTASGQPFMAPAAAIAGPMIIVSE